MGDAIGLGDGEGGVCLITGYFSQFPPFPEDFNEPDECLASNFMPVGTSQGKQIYIFKSDFKRKRIHTSEALNDGLIGRCGLNGFAVLGADNLNFFACLGLVDEWDGLKRFSRNSNGENGG